MILSQDLLEKVLALVKKAGEKVLAIYNEGPISSVNKEDGSPLTKADLLAHDIICHGLNAMDAAIPILSEESSQELIKNRHDWEMLWMLDPLDGTQEFIHHTHEFTINIALIHDHKPILGVVYAPALGLLYYAMDGFGAYKEEQGKKEKIFVSSSLYPKTSPIRIVASRRHGQEELHDFLKKIPNYTLTNIGSALKICLIAEGKADLYPRLGPTSEWDTAAAHAIVNNAGGILCDLNYQPFKYNVRNTLLNGPFLVSSYYALRFMLDIC